MKYFSGKYHEIILDVKFQMYKIIFKKILLLKNSFNFLNDS